MTLPASEPAALLATLWREVSRHRTIGETTVALFELLQPHIPLSFILVRRWAPSRERLETIAVAPAEPVMESLPSRVSVPTPRRIELERWASEGRLTAWFSREQTGLGRLLVPEGLTGPVQAAPLLEDGQLMGVVIVGGPALSSGEVVELFATALRNERRLEELARLREAAEQDRQALLSRLGREDVSDAIVGAEAGLREVMTRVAQVAPTDAPVLILGETGAGKEVVARAIHSRSRRERGPFLRVNCGAIPTELVDSELFGHEKGAFTGAVNQRKGWFERADGGTLFLDEVGELPAAAQVRLLRVLQDGTFQRVGGQHTHTVDVRIVAATHRDMTTMVRDGRFRQDLWYRISVFPIHLPSLRERRSDIPLLARHFAARAGLRLHGRPLVPGPEELDLLSAYEWPGNVRELASVIERAAILGDGHSLEVGRALGVSGQMPIHRNEQTERDAVIEALRRTHGRIEGPFGAARALGINPHTLRSRMRRMGIEWSQYRE